MNDRRTGQDRRAGMVDVEISETGQHKTLAEDAIETGSARLDELEAEILSLRVKLRCARAALKLRPGQIDDLQELVIDLKTLLAQDRERTMFEKIKTFSRDWLAPVAFGAVVMYGFLFALSETIPEHAPEPAACSCAGLENCSIAIFKPDPDTRAYCAMVEDGPSCCEIVRSDP